jgi:hypothetical protein
MTRYYCNLYHKSPRPHCRDRAEWVNAMRKDWIHLTGYLTVKGYNPVKHIAYAYIPSYQYSTGKGITKTSVWVKTWVWYLSTEYGWVLEISHNHNGVHRAMWYIVDLNGALYSDCVYEIPPQFKHPTEVFLNGLQAYADRKYVEIHRPMTALCSLGG